MAESEDPATSESADDGLSLARDIANSYRGRTSPARSGVKRRARPVRPVRQEREDASPLADLLDEVVRDQGWQDRLAATRVFTDWPGIVGPEVAQHSRVTAFDDGVVEVLTDSTAWATQLRLLAPRIVAKLNTELGDGSVLRIQVSGPQAPSWRKGKRSVRGARGPRDTYG